MTFLQKRHSFRTFAIMSFYLCMLIFGLGVSQAFADWVPICEWHAPTQDAYVKFTYNTTPDATEVMTGAFYFILNDTTENVVITLKFGRPELNKTIHLKRGQGYTLEIKPSVWGPDAVKADIKKSVQQGGVSVDH